MNGISIGVIATLCSIAGFILGNLIKPLIAKIKQELEWRKAQENNDKNFIEKIDEIHEQVEHMNVRLEKVELALAPMVDNFCLDAGDKFKKLYGFEIEYLCEKFEDKIARKKNGEDVAFSMREIGDFHNLYKTYKELGGNGKIEAIYQTVEEKLKPYL